MREVGKRRGPRARIWETVTFGGHGGEERPAKETEKGATNNVRGKPRESCVLGAEGRELINKGKDLLGQEDSEVKPLVKQPVTESLVKEAPLPPSLSSCPFLSLSHILLHSFIISSLVYLEVIAVFLVPNICSINVY